MTYTIDQIREKLLIKYPQVITFLKTEAPTEGAPEELTANSILQLNMFIEDAVNLLEPYEETWGKLFLSGLLLLSAHLLARGTEGETNSGVIRRKKKDENETEFATPTVEALGPLSTTKYGTDFEAMEKRVFCIEEDQAEDPLALFII